MSEKITIRFSDTTDESKPKAETRTYKSLKGAANAAVNFVGPKPNIRETGWCENEAGDRALQAHGAELSELFPELIKNLTPEELATDEYENKLPSKAEHGLLLHGEVSGEDITPDKGFWEVLAEQKTTVLDRVTWESPTKIPDNEGGETIIMERISFSDLVKSVRKAAQAEKVVAEEGESFGVRIFALAVGVAESSKAEPVKEQVQRFRNLLAGFEREAFMGKTLPNVWSSTKSQIIAAWEGKRAGAGSTEKLTPIIPGSKEATFDKRKKAHKLVTVGSLSDMRAVERFKKDKLKEVPVKRITPQPGDIKDTPEKQGRALDRASIPPAGALKGVTKATALAYADLYLAIEQAAEHPAYSEGSKFEERINTMIRSWTKLVRENTESTEAPKESPKEATAA